MERIKVMEDVRVCAAFTYASKNKIRTRDKNTCQGIDDAFSVCIVKFILGVPANYYAGFNIDCCHRDHTWGLNYDNPDNGKCQCLACHWVSSDNQFRGKIDQRDPIRREVRMAPQNFEIFQKHKELLDLWMPSALVHHVQKIMFAEGTRYMDGGRIEVPIKWVNKLDSDELQEFKKAAEFLLAVT